MESFVAAAETLKERGAYKIYVMATHGILSAEAPRLIEESPIDEVCLLRVRNFSKRGARVPLGCCGARLISGWAAFLAKMFCLLRPRLGRWMCRNWSLHGGLFQTFVSVLESHMVLKSSLMAVKCQVGLSRPRP